MKYRANILRKIKNRNGETIVEVLVALLISSLGMIMLANMIVTSTNLITRSKETLTAYANAQVSNKVIERSDSSAGSGTVTMKVAASGGTISTVKINDDVDTYDGTDVEGKPTIAVTYYENSTVGTHTVISYKVGSGS